MNSLTATIRQEIERLGPLSFARFMELALYHPQHGYYERPAVPIGRRGDFFTSVSVGNLFGELLGFQFAAWLEPENADARNEPFPCQIVEAGAHDGRLALDLLTFLAAHRRELLARLEYWIIEPSAGRRERQRKTLQPFASQARWFGGWNAIPTAGVRGVIFANELLDALPVSRLGWDAAKRKWFEWGVAAKEERFVWVRMNKCAGGGTAGTLDFPELPAEVQPVLPDGFTVEVCPAAAAWWQESARALGCGKLLTLDYGHEEGELIRPERINGTVRAYSMHRVTGDLLSNVGEQDLTAHVNFVAIQRAGEAAGLRTEALVSQERFLTRLAERIWREGGEFPPWTMNRTQQFRTLTHPAQMGGAFRVLVQSRLA